MTSGGVENAEVVFQEADQVLGYPSSSCLVGRRTFAVTARLMSSGETDSRGYNGLRYLTVSQLLIASKYPRLKPPPSLVRRYGCTSHFRCHDKYYDSCHCTHRAMKLIDMASA